VTRRLAYLVATGVVAVLGMLAVAPAAWAAPAVAAHATLVSTTPAGGAVLGRPPARVSATFDEPVGVSANSLEVFAPDGSRVEAGATAHGREPQEITVRLRSGLVHGTYTVGWHVISADSHPVGGAFTFSVGAPSSTSVNPATLGTPSGALVGLAFGIVRYVAFICFALLIGAVAFVIWCWPAGAGRPAVLRLVMGAWGGLALSVLAAVLLQGVYGAGQGVGHVFLPDVLHATLYSRYGRALGVRLLLVIAALFLFSVTLGGLPAQSRRARVTAGVAWGILTVALASTWAVADHAGTGIQVPLSIPSDIVHLSAVAIWMGGLVMIAVILLRRPRQAGSKAAGAAARRRGHEATAEAALAVTRFSPIALGCVVAIVMTGTYQAWRGVGTLGALTGTTYGRLLLVKIAGMCALIALGYVARLRIAEGLRAPVATGARVADAVPAARVQVGAGGWAGLGKVGLGLRPGSASSSSPSSGNGSSGNGSHPGTQPDSGHVAVTLARLRISVAVEVAIAAAVLAATAILVNTPTARETFTRPASATVPFDTGTAGGRGSMAVTVAPARLGSNRVRVSITSRAGRPYRPRQIQAALSLPARHLGPLSVPLTLAHPGQYVSGPVTVTITGQWQLEITIRSDAFDETTVTVPVPVH
jgi:copper transport protein